MLVLEQAQAATKTAYQRMMDAATKTANLFTLCAEQATDPDEAAKHRYAAQQWQNTAQVAAEHWRNL